ncbi:MAG TPA: PhnD/SsuA/transferrin family substrate-binding protein [Burkholderiales bacterium]|nr:PhnD/SsuA/transferrin family substrate-binding protein [Burkholderiales bacterium]
MIFTNAIKAMSRWIVAPLAAGVALVAAAEPAATPPDFVFSVTEGVTYQATPKEIREKFEPLAEVIGKALHRNVKVLLVPAYDDVRAGLARQDYDLAFIHPAHVAMAEVKVGRYRSIAWTSGYTDYSVSLLAKADEPIKDLKELRGRKLVTPDPDSITAAMVRAMLRAQDLRPGDLKILTTRYQDAVPFYLEYGFAQVGATAANSVVKLWTDKGGKVVLRSRGVPIKQFIASSRLAPDVREKIRDVLINLAQSEQGRRALAASGYKAFVGTDAEVEEKTIAWLGL